MDGSLPLWGRPLDEYIDHYQFENIKQRGRLNEDPELTSTREAAAALSALARVGDGGGPDDSKALSAPVTIQNLRAILKLVPYPRAYRSIARPAVIGGCIKLMSRIKLNSRCSPFSYEYGYLCFRVLTIVLGICILDRSDLLDPSVRAMPVDHRTHPQLDVLQLLGHYVSSGIFQCLSKGGYGGLDWMFGWTKVKGRPEQSPLVNISEIELLSSILWYDRKAFFKALKSTYYPGISAIIFVLWRVSRHERGSTKLKFQSTVVKEISFRYNLLATSDQQHAITYMNIDILSSNSLAIWDENTRQVDLEDCREVISAYIDRFNPTHTTLYGPMLVLHGPIFLRSVARFVTPGTEHFLPTVLKVTVERIWDEMKNPSEPHKPDVYVDSIRDTFANYATILQNGVFGQMNRPFFQELLDNIIDYDLIDLAARAMLMLELPSEPPAHALAGSADYLPCIKHFYGQLCVSMPKQYIYVMSDQCLPEWLKFRSYLTWYPEMRRLIPKDREHIKKCLDTWIDMGKSLGYQVHEKSRFKCDYARCHDPLGIDGVQFTCPICHSGAFCSARCQSLDWKFGGLQSVHGDSCVGAKALVKFQPPAR
ncbi:Zf-MYND domain protein [Rhizoctonia solani 123E]|uniref:Zf-MYND domain protein n=1 Tax=Rhizoctonia solani 123E TaxID=1423351 RepID=A0A074RQU0_9AGAM|nr:Zf-MYND domain protein [Rhizoctonia solani 123E]